MTKLFQVDENRLNIYLYVYCHNLNVFQSEDGVTNPAFDNMERLQINGHAWSETSSDNNKDESVTNRKAKSDISDSSNRLQRRSVDVQDKRR